MRGNRVIDILTWQQFSQLQINMNAQFRGNLNAQIGVC